MYPSSTSVALVSYSSTIDVAGIFRTGVLVNKDWVRMYFARHLEEQVLGLVRSSS